MTERIGDKVLQELLEQNNADVNLDQSSSGLPRVRITFPTLDELSSNVVCDGCNEQGAIEYDSRNHSLPRHGVVVRFENLQRVNAPSCHLEEMDIRDPNLDTDKFYRCLDTCIHDRAPEGSLQHKIEALTVKYVKSSLNPTRPTPETLRHSLQAGTSQ